jgi:hypothetical protein
MTMITNSSSVPPDDKYIMANCNIIVDVETGKIIYDLTYNNGNSDLFSTYSGRPSHDWKYIVQLFLWSDDPDENSILLVRNPWYLATHSDINGVEVEGTLHPNPTNGMVIIPLDNWGSSRVDLQACKLGTGRRFTTS